VTGTADNPTCARIRAMLHELAQGRGSDEMRNEAGAHVNACPDCLAVRRLAAELTCKEIAAFLDDVVEGRLTHAQQTVFDTHLALCPPCVDYVNGYRQCVSLAQCSCDDDGVLPEGMPPGLVDAILAARKAEDA
jgi:anti-sigma factor RsiW